MHTTEIRVEGSSGAELAGALYERLLGESKGSVERHDGDGFDVVVVERYSLRNNSNQQATVIVESADADACDISIVSGGGGAGLLGLNLGSESKQADAIVSAVEDLCEAEGLRVETR